MSSRPVTKNLGAALILLVMILAFVLRFYHLGSRPFYGDEPFHTVMIAAKSPSYIMSTNFGSILYALMVHFLLPLGKTEVMARLPAALFGFMSVWLIFLIGRMLFRKKEAILAAFLAATSTHFIFFSQEARAYSGMLLFSLCSYYFFLRVLKGAGSRHWIYYGVSTIIAIYLHFFSLIIIPVHILTAVILWLRRRRPTKTPQSFSISSKQILLFMASLLAIFAISYFLYAPTRNQQASENLFLALPHSLANLIRGKLTIEPLSLIADILKRQLDYVASPVLFFLKLSLIILGILAGARRRVKETTLLLGGILVPIALFVLSNPPVIYLPVDKKFIFILPFVILLMARGGTAVIDGVSVLVRKIPSRRDMAPFSNVAMLLPVLLIVAGEAVPLRMHKTAIWDLRALAFDRDVRSRMITQVVENEMFFSESSEALLNFLPLWPVLYSDGTTKILMFDELGDSNQRSTPLTPTGLWLYVRSTSSVDQVLAKWLPDSPAVYVEALAGGRLIHFPRNEQPLWKTLALSVDLVRDLAREPRDDMAYRLFLGKIYLLSSENKKALELLDGLDWKSATSGEGDPRKLLQELLAENCAELLLENGVQALGGGKNEEVSGMLSAAEQLGRPGSNIEGRIAFAQAEALLRKGLPNDARRFYLQALPFCQSGREEDYVLGKIRELHSLPCGFLIWRLGKRWHVRWWSDESRQFSGEIAAPGPVRNLTGFRSAKGDRVRSSDAKILFSSTSGKLSSKGLDFEVRGAGKILFSLQISGEKDILSKILIAEKPGNPDRMPFSLE